MGDSRFHTFAWEVPTPGRTSGASRNIDLRYVERTVLVGVTYYIAAVLGLRLALVGHQVTPVWPPTGVALVGFLLFGRRIWPGVAIAAFFVNLPLGPTTTAALGIAVGNTLAPLFAATLLGKGRFRLELNRFRDALILVFLGALVGMTVSATWGSLTLLAAGGVRTSEFWQTWWTWWAGDAMGVLAVAPFLLSLRSVRFDRHGSWGRRLEAVTGFAVLAVVATLAFRGPVRIEYLVFPLLVWAAWRFGQRGAAPAALLTISIATLAAVQGTGMFAHDSLLGKMASLQVFNASVALASFVLAAILAERRRAQEDLRQHQEWVNGMLDSAPGAIMVVDEGGDVLLANPRAEEIFGYEAGALVGVSIESVVPETFRADHLRHRSDYLNDVSSRPMGQGMDLTGRRRDGSEFPVEIGLSSFATPERRLVTAFINDITLRKRAEQELEHMALHDPLTGLANRAVFMERLTQALARTERRPSSVAVLFIDLDHFKTINDNFGHEVGDRVLKSVGDRLRHALRPEDTAARFGGDEFVVLCEDLEDERHLVTIADRIMSAVSEPIPLETGEIVITPSIGIATTRGVEDRPETLLRDADSAAYRAKEGGRGRFELFDQEMRSRALSRSRTEAELRRAIRAGELRLHYQPVVVMDDLRIEKVEALVRWLHPRRGLLFPDEFIPVAEESGLIIDLGQWVLREACSQSVRWERGFSDRRPASIAVNVSARQLAHPDFEQTVVEIFDETGAEPKNFWFEITETAFIDPAPPILESLRRLRALGVRLAIDDFGTGYSSLSHLRHFSVDELKVDRSFVGGLGDDASDTSIVVAVVNLAHSLGLSAVAEGVENAEQSRQLQSIGCDLAQGYFFSMPEPPARLQERFLRLA